jgi:uncharacterized membrane protein YebE (DUF533 family)
MIDFKSVLGTLLESGLAPSASQRMGQAIGGQQSGGGLSSILSSLGGGQGGGNLGAMLGGLLGNAQQTAGGLLGSAQQAAGDAKREVQAGNPLAVGGLGALAGALLGGMRGSPAKGALGGAAMAVLGQIAMSALQKGMGGGAASAQPGLAETGASGFQEASVEEITGDARAELLLRAMINAAKADGQIDGTEMNNILGKLDEAGAGQDAKDFVLAEMRRPLDLDGLVAGVNSPDTAAAVYAASVMAIRVDTPAEETYLSQLAARLKIPAQVQASLNASLGVGRTA